MVNLDRNFVCVNNVEDPKDYINSDGMNKCYDIGHNEYAISNNGEELFTSFDNNSTVIISVNENGKILFNGDISPLEAYALLSKNNFIDNSSIYLYSKESNFDSLEFSSIIEKATDSASLITVPNFGNDDMEHSINVNDSSLAIANDKEELISYDLTGFLSSKKTK